MKENTTKRPRDTGGDKTFRAFLGSHFGGDLSEIISYLNLLIDSVEGIQMKLPDNEELFPERILETLWAEGGESVDSKTAFLTLVRSEANNYLTAANKTLEQILQAPTASADTANASTSGGVADHE